VGQALSALLSGLVFGAGLVISGMSQPAKVIGFLDVSGAWDPSLGLVMVGAIAVYSPLYHLVFARGAPPHSIASLVPDAGVDRNLVLGAAIFGAGWGLSGFCPGPAIVATGSGTLSALAFAASMLVGMGLFHLVTKTLR